MDKLYNIIDELINNIKYNYDEMDDNFIIDQCKLFPKLNDVNKEKILKNNKIVSKLLLIKNILNNIYYSNDDIDFIYHHTIYSIALVFKDIFNVKEFIETFKYANINTDNLKL